ncbi:glycosyltransferase family 2 protein [Candidatus Woesebacteria bacterium]|nr:glycosyltransferase family 2 protein [Candidatus Woesebacteria bacterium]
MKSTPFFSIVIPTLNEENFLPKLLLDLKNQSYKDFEIIHVDGNSQDKTVDLASKFDVKTQVVEKRNVSYQRNVGINLAKGKWIIFMDADNRIGPEFIGELKKQINKNQEYQIFSTLVASDDYKIFEKITNLWLSFREKFKHKAVLGSMIIVKTIDAKKFRFDETQKVLEDLIFVQKMISSGFKFKILKHPKYFYSYRRYYSDGILKTLKKNCVTIVNYYIKGKDFKDSNFGYEMSGGSRYFKKEDLT